MKTYKSLLSELKRLSAAAEKQRRKEVASVVAEIRGKMSEFGITVDDLRASKRAAGKPAAKKKRKGAKSSRKGKSVPPKYRDPETKATWSGRGLTPRWLAAHESTGRKREEFLIAPAEAKKKKG